MIRRVSLDVICASHVLECAVSSSADVELNLQKESLGSLIGSPGFIPLIIGSLLIVF